MDADAQLGELAVCMRRIAEAEVIEALRGPASKELGCIALSVLYWRSANHPDLSSPGSFSFLDSSHPSHTKTLRVGTPHFTLRS